LPVPHRGGWVSIPGQCPTSEIYGRQTGTWTVFCIMLVFFFQYYSTNASCVFSPTFLSFGTPGTFYTKVFLLLVASLKDTVGEIIMLTAASQPRRQSSRIPSLEHQNLAHVNNVSELIPLENDMDVGRAK
jgi:hypothetical protein